MIYNVYQEVEIVSNENGPLFPTTVRFDARDKKLLETLTQHFRKQFPKMSHADVLRRAMRDLADKEGVKIENEHNA